MSQEPVYFRPPSEADSFIVQVMHGCSHNLCTFCNMFKKTPLRVIPLEEVLKGIEADARSLGERFIHLLTSLYLEGGDPMALSNSHLLRIMEHAHTHFPALTRIVFYATARAIMAKTPEELAALRAAGLQRVFVGLESGCDDILAKTRKGCLKDDMIRAGRKLTQASIENDVSMMLGIGGPELSERHAIETADLLNAVNPVCVRVRTYTPTEDTLMGEDYRQGRFILMEPHEILRELRLMVEQIQAPMQLLSEHWTNFIMFDAMLPEGKEDLLACIDKALLLPREQFRPIGITKAVS